MQLGEHAETESGTQQSSNINTSTVTIGERQMVVKNLPYRLYSQQAS